ncbi:MAG: GTPase Der [Verrucomicrobiota bacterium]|jgi:GTP-binding protein
MSGLIAIVGRPNVGKSALFNRIVGRRIAIVHDQPGVTRDRVMAEAEWHGRPYTLVDTGGIGLLRREKADDVITAAALQQVDLAIDAADVILFVVNVQEGIVPLDQEVAKKLRTIQKPVLLVVNKADNYQATAGAAEFSQLGFQQIYPVTAIHGSGVEDLMDEAVAFLPQWSAVSKPIETDEADSQEANATLEEGEDGEVLPPRRPDGPKRLAIVGRPNVGKSSIINRVTGSDRVIVSAIPGTTRDAVDVPFEVVTEAGREQYVLVDTAGVRKARRIDDSIEYFSVERTKGAIARCDIAVLVIDAMNGITEQDKKIADVIVEQRRACIVVVNKWDLVAEDVRKAREQEIEVRSGKNRDRDDRQKRLTTLSEFGQWVQERLFFLDYAPVIFTSAKDGFQLDRLLEAVRYVSSQLKQKVPTAILNRTLNDAIERRQPVSDMGHRLKFYYATQVRQAPPTFLLFVNRDELFSSPYMKYLSGEMRKAFGYEGCPILLVPKPRPKTIESVRRFRKQPFAHKREGGERKLSPLAERAVARKAARSENPVTGKGVTRSSSRPGTPPPSRNFKSAKPGMPDTQGGNPKFAGSRGPIPSRRTDKAPGGRPLKSDGFPKSGGWKTEGRMPTGSRRQAKGRNSNEGRNTTEGRKPAERKTTGRNAADRKPTGRGRSPRR